MALTIPKLPFAQHRKTLVYITNVGDAEQLGQAIADFIDAESTYWEVNARDPAAEYQWWELKPKAGSATPNQRIVIAQKSVIGAPSNILSPHNAVSDQLYWALAPSVAGSAALAADPLGAAAGAIYAGGTAFQNRCTGWLKNMPQIGGTAYYWLFLHETSEWIGVGFVDTVNSTVWCNWVGAFITAPDDEDGDPGPSGAYDAGRIYGITGGTSAIANSFWTGVADDYMQWGGTGTASWLAFAFDPQNPTTARRIQFSRAAGSALYAGFGSYNEQRTYMGCHQGMPAHYHWYTAPYNLVGRHRQTYLGGFGRYLLDEGLEGGGHKMYYNSGSPNSVYQGMLLTDD